MTATVLKFPVAQRIPLDTVLDRLIYNIMTGAADGELKAEHGTEGLVRMIRAAETEEDARTILGLYGCMTDGDNGYGNWKLGLECYVGWSGDANRNRRVLEAMTRIANSDPKLLAEWEWEL